MFSGGSRSDYRLDESLGPLSLVIDLTTLNLGMLYLIFLRRFDLELLFCSHLCWVFLYFSLDNSYLIRFVAKIDRDCYNCCSTLLFCSSPIREFLLYDKNIADTVGQHF